MANSLWRFWGW